MRRSFMMVGIFFFIISTCSLPHASAKKFRVTVIGGKVYPFKSSGDCWDPCFNSKKKQKQFSTLEKLFSYLSIKDIVLIMTSNSSEELLKRILKSSFFGHLALDYTLKALRKTFRGLSMPDPYLRINFDNGEVIKTHYAKNTIVPIWNVVKVVSISPNTPLQIYLWDKDLKNDDPIKYWIFRRIPPHLFEYGGIWTISQKPFTQIQLRLTPIDEIRGCSLPPRKYTVSILSASIEYKKKNGKYWDIIHGKPDPYVILKLGNKVIRTNVDRNTYSPSWNSKFRIFLTGRETMDIKIFDKDISRDDLIGSCRTKLVGCSFEGGSYLFNLRCGQASNITFRFR